MTPEKSPETHLRERVAAVLSTARDRGATLAAAESCTGGMVAAALTSVPGSSDVFLGSIVAYADGAKSALLDVTPVTLSTHGSVSEAVAVEMALGGRSALRASHAIAVTGIAGPSGGSTGKPVGTVWFAVTDGERVFSDLHRFDGDRTEVRSRATAHALDLLHCFLEG